MSPGRLERTRPFRFTLFALGLTVGAAMIAADAHAQSVPTGFAVQSVVSEPFAAAPVGFTFLPDGRILLVEKDTGNVRLAAAGATTSAVIATVPDLTIAGERGLLGVAVDPGWPARPYVYFHSTHADTSIHITMYRATGDVANPASTSMVLDMPYLLLRDRDQYEHHNGGTLRFGPDGRLYASFGDDGFTCLAQDVDFLNGKILRLDVARMPGTGNGPPPKADITPPDNPFSGSSPNAGLVFARGLRNPFRFTIDPVTNDLYIGDVGALAWEEIDAIAYEGYAGDNFGWPEREGFEPHTCCPECRNDPPYVDPIYAYPNPPDPLSAAVTGGPLYRRVLGAAYSFGFEYDANVFFGDWAGRWLRRLVRTNGTWSLAAPVPGQPNPLDWATNLGRPVDLQNGADGALYFIAFPGGPLPRGLWRIVRTTPVDVAVALNRGGIDTRCSPNPASRSAGVTIEYYAVQSEPVRLRIFDVRGRLVRGLEGNATAGEWGSLRWDGRTLFGREAPAALYLYRLDTGGGGSAHGRMTLVR